MITGSIVLYNNERDVLLEAIESFLASPLAERLYLIDNSPEDGLRDLIFDDRVEYVHNPQNPGFGAAHNIAIKLAINLGSTYHLVLNPDVFYSQGVLEELLVYMEARPDVANVMPKVLYPNGDLQYLCKLLPTPYDWIGRRFNPFKKMVNRRNELFELRFTEYNREMEVPYLSGCFMFLRVSALERVGLFDDGIFMYGEETDLCRRFIADGHRTMFYPKVTIYHHFEKGSHKSWRLTKIGINSAVYYFNKWGWFFDTERKTINRKILAKLQR